MALYYLFLQAMKQFLSKITLLNASVLTILTFVIGSLIGGTVLWLTEQDREVVARVPYTALVTVTPNVVDTNPLTGEYASVERHTFTKEARYQGERFVDTWFTAVSALCVTGLTSTDFSQFTPAGQVTVMVLIQMGGLGIIVFTSIFAIAVFRGLSERTPMRRLLGSVLNSEQHDVSDMLKYVFLYTFVFEFVGFLIMGVHLQWFADPSLLQGTNPWWWSLFHSISAFNNAGFGLLNNNLMSFATDPVINFTIAALIILGGLGYPVLIAIYFWLRTRVFRFRLTQTRIDNLRRDLSGVASLVQVRVALIGTVLLLVVGTVIPFLIEYSNPIEMQYTFGEKLLINFFQSVSTRTAGFNTVDIGVLHISTIFLYMILMFIGANPAGTAGGIKIPTVAVLYGYVKDWFAAPRQPVTLVGRSISKFAVSHAIRLLFFSLIFVGLVTFLITVFENIYLITPDSLFNFQKVLFEVVSAFGTVGLTMGFRDGVTSFTAIFSDSSKILIIITMLVGRVGPLAILEALPWKRVHEDAELSPDFPNSDKIQIG